MTGSKQRRRIFQTSRSALRIAPVITLVLLLAAAGGGIAVVVLDLMSGARAFVASESLWSRAQQDVVFHLDRYAETGRPVHLRTARERLRIPLAVRDARIALDASPPDFPRARAGFLAGENHPQDVERLIRLHRQLPRSASLRRAWAIWRESDIWVLRLERLADELETLWTEPGRSSTMLSSVRDELALIDRSLGREAAEFSAAIGQATRELVYRARQIAWAVVLVIALLLMLAIAWALRGMRRSETRFWTTFEKAPVGMALIDRDSTLVEVNDALCRLLRRPSGETRGRPLSHFSHTEDRTALRKFVADGAIGDAPLGDLETRYLAPDGEHVWGKLSLARLNDGRQHRDSGDLQVAVLEDISESHRLAGELAYQAAHDQLTGLPNRREFERQLNRVLHGVAQRGGQHALCLVDLDQFKVVNDSFGHLAGDALLVRLTERVQECLREMDLLARLDGDEFGLLLMDCPVDIANEVAERIRETIAAFEFHWEERPITISASIGLVPIHSGNHDAAVLLQQVNIACHEAKEQGRNRLQVHSDERTSSRRRHAEMSWVHRINQALSQGRLRFHGQLIKPLNGDRYRCELLLRLQGDEELHTASQFMEAAERFHIARTVDRWVIDNVLDEIRAFECRDDRIHAWHINLSGQSVDCKTVLPDLIERIRSRGVPPEKLCFEITESAAITSLEEAREFFSALRELGCQIALDDFGKGLSTFDYLKQLPVDLVKIDGGFVRELAHSELDHAMVRSVHEIARVAGLETIAESVESVEVLIRLKQIGIDYLQGHVIHNPVRLRELVLPGGEIETPV